MMDLFTEIADIFFHQKVLRLLFQRYEISITIEGSSVWSAPANFLAFLDVAAYAVLTAVSLEFGIVFQ